MDTLEWLEHFLLVSSDGDWEHCGGITIENLNNLGWRVEIVFPDLVDYKTKLDSFQYKASDKDWWQYKIEEDRFIASGSPNNLSTILKYFRKLVEDEIYTIKIEKFNNLNWRVEIVFPESVDYETKPNSFHYKDSDEDWWQYKIEEDRFIASGSPNNLSTILRYFRKLVVDEL